MNALIECFVNPNGLETLFNPEEGDKVRAYQAPIGSTNFKVLLVASDKWYCHVSEDDDSFVLTFKGVDG